MNNMLMTLFGVMIIGTFSSEEVFSVDNLNKPTSGNQSEVLKEDVPLENQAIGINLDPVQDSINGEVGSEGSLDLGFFEDIKLEGIYTEIKDNPYIALESDGTWRALKVGNTKIVVGVELSQNTLDAIKNKYPNREVIYPSKPPKILEVKIGKSISIRYNFSPSSIETEIGATGVISVGDFEDIPLTGTFKEVKDNPFVEVQKDGTWKALKVGETAILPTFSLSEESLKKIEEKYPDKQIMVQEIQQFIPVKINDPANSVKDRIGIRLEPLENEIVGMVGESGHLTLGEFEGIKLEGVFTEIKDNPYIEISSNGTWKALTAGEDAIYVGVELSDKTVKDIKEKYPDREIIYPELLPKKIKVSIKNLTTQTNQNAGVQTSNKGSSTKTGELPKTGESQSQFVFQIWGLNLLAIYTFTTLFKKIF